MFPHADQILPQLSAPNEMLNGSALFTCIISRPTVFGFTMCGFDILTFKYLSIDKNNNASLRKKKVPVLIPRQQMKFKTNIIDTAVLYCYNTI
jgi:hypothetical protein